MSSLSLLPPRPTAAGPGSSQPPCRCFAALARPLLILRQYWQRDFSSAGAGFVPPPSYSSTNSTRGLIITITHAPPRALWVCLLPPQGSESRSSPEFHRRRHCRDGSSLPVPGPCLQRAEQRGLVLEAACITANAIVLIGFYEFPPEFLRNTSTLEDFIPANFRLQSQTVHQMNLRSQAYSQAAPATGAAPAKRLVMSSLAEGTAS